MDADLRTLTEELRWVLGLDESDPATVAKHAAQMGQHAAKRGDQKAVGFWRTVYQHAKDKLGTAAGRPAGGDPSSHRGGHDMPSAPAPGAEPDDDGDGDKKPEPKKKTGLRAKIKAAGAAIKGAGAAVKGVAAKAAEKIKNAPAAVKKLVTDPEYRRETGKNAAAAIKRGAAKVVLHAVNEVEEVIKAGGVLGKAATGKKLTDEDKHVLRAGAKALATTLVGTIAMGGLAHVTATALGTHFAAETALKSIGKAAMYAGLATEAEKSAMLQAWAEEVVRGIQEGFAQLGDMDPELLATILAEAHSDDADDADAGDDEE